MIVPIAGTLGITTDALRKINYSKMSAYIRAGEHGKAEQTRDRYLKEIRESGEFTEEELKSVEKEFTDEIYIL